LFTLAESKRKQSNLLIVLKLVIKSAQTVTMCAFCCCPSKKVNGNRDVEHSAALTAQEQQDYEDLHHLTRKREIKITIRRIAQCD
jgi:ureidoglycolate hydrolase